MTDLETYRLRLGVQYDGSAYYGWQAQSALPSIQEELAKALSKVVLHDVKIVGAGRTDKGVHAWGQVCHADVTKVLEPVKYIGGMNRFLPHDIRVVDAAIVRPDFHARFSATARHYVYRIWHGRQLRPDLIQHVGHVPSMLDFEAMQEAIRLMPLGISDFTGFRDAECQSHITLCDLFYLRLVQESANLWNLEIGANHFLHHMVRNIMGTLVDIGRGRRPVTGLVDVLNDGVRAKAGMTFPADGLYLVRVDYA